jgi:hypothetical protein
VRYYVNKNSQANGDHEVHTATCSFLPSESNRIYLGDFATCSPAVSEARKHYSQCNGSPYVLAIRRVAQRHRSGPRDAP